MGDYKILLRLVDAVGVKSDPLTISLVIVSNGSDEESESAVDVAIGKFYAKVLEDREKNKQAALAAALKNKNIVRPKAEIKDKDVTKTGKVKISFSKPMELFEDYQVDNLE